MIEFLLLFALGFLAAALLALIVAPVIHSRIVTLTERRVKSSIPLSASEISAGKDAARAAFAAENARLTVGLRERSERLTRQTAQTARLEEHVGKIDSEKLALQQVLGETEMQAGELRLAVQENEERILSLQGELGEANLETSSLAHEVGSLQERVRRLDGIMEELRIDIAARDTEAENYKVQLQALRDERATLREQIRNSTVALRETEVRLKREQGRAAKLDDRLAGLFSTLSDREQLLERRADEIARLKQPIQPKDPTRQNTVSDMTSSPEASSPLHKRSPTRNPAELAEQLRARQAALVERLLKAKNAKNDKALRREIAAIATMMIELTLLREGQDSPIPGMLRELTAPTEAGAESSLAKQALARIKS